MKESHLTLLQLAAFDEIEKWKLTQNVGSNSCKTKYLVPRFCSDFQNLYCNSLYIMIRAALSKKRSIITVLFWIMSHLHIWIGSHLFKKTK